MAFNKNLLFLFIFIPIFGLSAKENKPIIKNGILDLRNWDQKEHPSIKIEGEFRFFWDELVNPKESLEGKSFALLNPSKNIPIGTTLSNGFKFKSFKGSYSFVVDILLPKDSKNLGIAFNSRPALAKKYLIGYPDKVDTIWDGIVSNQEESSIPWKKKAVYKIQNSETLEKLRVVFQYANYDVASIKVASSRIGNFKQLKSKMEQKTTLGALAVGILFIFFFYHLVLFFLRNEDHYSLYFSFFCLLGCLRLASTDQIYPEIFGEANRTILVFFYKAELFMITSGAAIFLAYLKTILKPQKAVTIGQKISEYIERVIYAIAIISSGYVVFANTYSVSSFIWLYQYFALVCILVVLAKIVMTIISRKGDARITAILILIFVSVVAYGAVRDILWNQETISVSFEQFIFPYTLVFFFIGQSFVLARLFSRAFRTSEDLVVRLDKIVDSGREISSKMEDIALFETLSQELKSITKCENVAIYFQDDSESSDNFQILLKDGNLNFKENYSPDSKNLKQFINKHSPLIISEIHSLPLTNSELKEAILAPVFGNSQDQTSEQKEQVIIGIVFLSGRKSAFDTNDLSSIQSIINSFEVQLVNISLLAETADKARMDAELKTAQAVQSALFPLNDPNDKDFELSGYFQSSSETGGDWYGYINEKDKIHILIGDVTGHGTPAALVTASVKGACSSLQEMINYGTVKDLKPSQILDFLNKTVYQTGQQKFVMTFFAAVYEPQNGRIIYANAGHNFPWFLKKAKANSVKDLENIRNFKKVNYLVARGPRLGNLINSKFNDEEVNLDPGDFIVFFTDGLIECCNEKKQEYGKKDCQNLMVKNHNKSAAEIKEEIIHNAFNFYGKEPREDDITLVVLKRLEGKQAEQVH